MSLFYDYIDITQLEIFSWCDFTSFSPFQQLATVIGFNILFYLFLILFLSIAYKTICRFLNFIF